MKQARDRLVALEQLEKDQDERIKELFNTVNPYFPSGVKIDKLFTGTPTLKQLEEFAGDNKLEYEK